MISLTPEASTQLDEFERYYIEQQRPQALRNLGHALAEASLVILNAPQRGLAAPAPIRSWRAWNCYGSSGAATGSPMIQRGRSLPASSSTPTTFRTGRGSSALYKDEESEPVER